MDRNVTLLRIAEILEQTPLPVDSEKRLHAGIAQALREAAIQHEHEVQLSKIDRIDFLCGDIGIEAKIAGSYTALASQVLRYLDSDRVSGLIIVTNKWSHSQLHQMANERNKPVHCCFVGFYGI